MSYQYAVEDTNYEDLSSGRVLYNLQGTTAFPVRLASEIFQRSKALMAKKGNSGPYTMYDPCCGGGYMLTVLGFLHGGDIAAIAASDVDPRAVELARKNLSLLNARGLNDRIGQLRRLYREYAKESHRAALESADRLAKLVTDIPAACFEADITKAKPDQGQVYDLVITDLPYGQLVGWTTESSDPVHALLGNLTACLGSRSLVAVVSTKEVSMQHESYRRTGSFKLGKRKVTFLELGSNS